MRHILIVTYGFPPGNLPSAHRNSMRARGLDELGYTVSVVTRPWKEQQNSVDPSEPSPRGITCERLTERTRVYRVPFGRGALRELSLVQRLALGVEGAPVPRALRTVARSACFLLGMIEHDVRLDFDFEELAGLLPSPPDVVLASGDPWSCFEIGRDLARRFGARYVADYRDPWNYLDDRLKLEGQNSYNGNVFSQVKRRLAMRLERKYNRGADLVISVSEPFLENALRMTGARNGLVVPNAFDPEEVSAMKRIRYPKFTITYVGTLYVSMNCDIFFKGLELFIDRNGIPPGEVGMKMIGTRHSRAFDRCLGRIRACRHHAEVVELTDRVPKDVSLAIQASSSVLVIFPVENSLGRYSAKIYEYIASGTPILCVPSDQGVIAELLRETNTGQTRDSAAGVAAYLESAYADWKSGGLVSYDPDVAAVGKYSYREVTQRLAERMERDFF